MEITDSIGGKLQNMEEECVEIETMLDNFAEKKNTTLSSSLGCTKVLAAKANINLKCLLNAKLYTLIIMYALLDLQISNVFQNHIQTI